MSRISLEEFGLSRPESGDDTVVPFALEQLDCRGRSVRLAAALHEIVTRHDYPAPVARVLGEAVLLATLVGSALKFDGRFILQSQTDGPVNMIVVDFDAPDGLRGYARFDQTALAAMLSARKFDTASLLGKGHLAMTLDQGPHMERYQGIVAIEGAGFETAAQNYFMQSEQIPTRVRLAVAQHEQKGEQGSRWRAGGMLLQHLPKSAASPGSDDLPGTGETAAPGDGETENWTEAQALFSTISDVELVDPDVSAERLLFRLFNEKGVTVFDPEKLVARCTCSAERTENMLMASFSAKERAEMAVDGEIEVVCEFCSTTYHFNLNQFDMEG